VTATRAVFLDRDGTLIEERNYPTRAADLVPLPGVARALGRLQRAGWLRVVLTNQSAIARGLLDEEQLAGLHAELLDRLRSTGGGWDALYYCPHHPDGKAAAYSFRCGCRKPAPGLVRLAVSELGIDLSASAFIGDQPRDLFPGLGGTGPRLLVRSGHPLTEDAGADLVVPSLVEAVDWLIARDGTT